MKHKNDYSAIVFFEDGSVKKWQFVHKLTAFKSFLDKSHPGWNYMNIYNRRERIYLKRFYSNEPVPEFL